MGSRRDLGHQGPGQAWPLSLGEDKKAGEQSGDRSTNNKLRPHTAGRKWRLSLILRTESHLSLSPKAAQFLFQR